MRIIDKAAGPILIRLAVVLCALVFLAPGAFGVSARASTEPAAESVSGTSSADETFGVRMTISFTDDDMVGHTAGDFASCQFRIRDGEGLYLTAELVPETGTYHITGTASDEAGATIFQGGQVPDDPTLLLIQGIAGDRCTMEMCGTLKGYLRIVETRAITVTDGSAAVNGTEAAMDGEYVLIPLHVQKPYPLPDFCCGGNLKAAFVCFIAGLVCLMLLLFVSVIFWRKNNR